MIVVVHPGSGSWFFTHPGSRIQGSKRHHIPCQQHCFLCSVRLRACCVCLSCLVSICMPVRLPAKYLLLPKKHQASLTLIACHSLSESYSTAFIYSSSLPICPRICFITILAEDLVCWCLHSFLVYSVANPRCLSRIPDSNFSPSRIPDPPQRKGWFLNHSKI